MKFNIKSTITVLALAGAMCSMSAQKSLYKLDVGDFSELKVSDGVNVEYNCSTDSAGWAFFECDPATAQMLMFTNKKNSLTIQIASDGAEVNDLPLIKVYSMTLQKVENDGDSLVTIGRTTPVREFKGYVVGNGTLVIDNLRTHKADLAIRTGSGHLVAKGSTREAKFHNVGTGKLEASGLQAEQSKCNLLGTGAIDCNASVELTVTGAGSGKVYYAGSPKKVSNRSIGVKAISVDIDQIVE